MAEEEKMKYCRVNRKQCLHSRYAGEPSQDVFRGETTPVFVTSNECVKGNIRWETRRIGIEDLKKPSAIEAPENCPDPESAITL